MMGGRGGGSGMGGKAAIGGGSGTVKIIGHNEKNRTLKLTSFSGNDGMVEAVDFGTLAIAAPAKSRLDLQKYDFAISSDRTWASGMYYNGDINSPLVIGVKMAMLQGVSEKQQNYAKNVLRPRLQATIEKVFGGAFMGKITVENAIQQTKSAPKMTAREILDKWR